MALSSSMLLSFHKILNRLSLPMIAYVSSLTFPDKGAKYLVLQEEASSLFFIGGYTESSHS